MIYVVYTCRHGDGPCQKTWSEPEREKGFFSNIFHTKKPCIAQKTRLPCGVRHWVYQLLLFYLPNWTCESNHMAHTFQIPWPITVAWSFKFGQYSDDPHFLNIRINLIGSRSYWLPFCRKWPFRIRRHHPITGYVLQEASDRDGVRKKAPNPALHKAAPAPISV